MWNQVWSKLKNSKIFWAFVVGIALFVGGYAVGIHHKVPAKIEEHQVEDVVSKQKLAEAQKTIASLQQQITVDQTQISELKTHVKTVTHIVYAKDGSKTVDKTTESDTDKTVDNKTDEKTNTNQTVASTDNKTVETDTKTHTDTTIKITPLVKDKYYLGLSAGLSLNGISDPGLEFKYRFLDLGRVSGWAGGELVAPVPDFKVQNIQLRLSLGVSF